MMQTIISKDCGNSPKNIFLQKMTIAMAGKDLGFLQASVSGDICWNELGKQQVEGIDAFIQVFSARYENIEELSILHVMTHGKAGAVDGRVRLTDGKVYAFCDVYEFSNVKGVSIKKITSYEIEIRE